MNDFEEHPSDKDLEPQKEESTQYTKSARRAFSKLAVELTDEDLKSKGVQKLLLEDIRRLEYENSVLDGFRETYHTADKECAVLKEKQQTNRYSEILYSAGLTVGAILIGLSPTIGTSSFKSWHFFALGLVMIAGSIFAKVVKK